MNMIKGEWKSIISKPMNILIICGLLFVPFLYNIIFLSAYWDPYGKTDQIPVAVVNEDKGATLDGEKLQVGNDFVENLKDNHTFDWKFTNKEEALKGLQNEKYYLVLELPKEFSENATTLMDKNPQKMKFIYHTNAGKNYSGAQIGSTAVTKINDEIKKEVTEQYAKTVFDSFKDVADGLQKASDGAGEIEDGSKTLRDNLKTLADSTVTFEDGAAKLATGISDAHKGANELHAGTVQLLTGAQTLNEKLGELSSGLSQLSAGGQKLYTASTQLEGGAVQLRDGLGKLQNGTKKLEGKLPEFVTGLNEANTKVSNVIQKINEKEQQINEIKEKIDARREEFNSQQQQIIESINNSETIPEDQKQTLIEEIKKLTSTQFMDEQQQHVNELKKQVDEVQVSAQGLQQLAQGGKDIQAAISQISSSQAKLYEGSVTLANGEKEFNQNFATFNGKLSEATEGSKKLAAGSQELATGLKDAEKGSGQLASGLGELNEGGNQLVNGTKQLEDGSNKLYDGSSKLADGTSELHTSLQEGADDAKDVKANDKTYSMFSDPTDVKGDKQNNIEKYGVGLTPYILCIGLFAGALMFSTVYPLKKPSITPTSGFSWFLSKFSVILFMGIFQTAIVATALLWGLNLEVTSIWRFYVFTMLTGVTFFTLVFFLSNALGKVGQYLAFVIMLLQIGGSSGTFPKALVPEFFQAINPYLPMTYAIRGLREIISIGQDYSYVWKQAAVLGGFSLVFMGLALAIFILNTKKEKDKAEDEQVSLS
ncbi:YhgE/Pip domain-containing protein [Priestia megaterium]|nr:YhgE/Pip domain-containing protein [Priestia megaterium]